jgi:hypothetical protein
MKTGRGNRNTQRKNLPQRHFVHHKSHMTIPGFEPGPPRGGKLATNRFELWCGHENLYITTFCVYFTTPSKQPRMTDESEGISEEAVVTWCRYYPNICLEWLF